MYVCLLNNNGSDATAYVRFWKFSILFFLSFFLTVLGLHCYMGFSLVVASRGCSLVMLHRLLTAMASPVAEPGSRAHELQ